MEENNNHLCESYDEMSDIRIVIDGNGNVIDEYSQSEKVEQAKKQREILKKIKAKQNCKNIVKEYFGNYFHYVYSKIPNKISPLEKVYLLKLSSVLDYNNKYIMVEHKNSPNHCKTKKVLDIQKLSGIKNKSTFYSFKESLENNNVLLKDDEGYYYLNPKYVVNGEINKKGSGYTRVFIEGFNIAFDNAKSKNRIYLGYSLELIKHCNLRYNVICKNTDEIDPNKIIPMSITEIASELGVDEKNSTRLITGLRSVKVDGDFLFMIKGVRKETTLYVNPNVYYGGQADDDSIEYMKEFFSIKCK